MRQVLFEDTEYPYLQPHARKRLMEARRLARGAGLDTNTILPQGGQTYAIFPWMGTRSYRTLKRVLRYLCGKELGIKSIEGMPSDYLVIKMEKGGPEELRAKLMNLGRQGIAPEELLGPNEAPPMQKFDKFVPASLLKKAFAYDQLEVEEFQQLIRGW